MLEQHIQERSNTNRLALGLSETDHQGLRAHDLEVLE